MNTIFNYSNHAILLALCFSSLLPSIRSQATSPPDSQQPYPYTRFTPSMAIIIVVLLAALFFMGFFSIYIRHCSDPSTRRGASASLRSRRSPRGLDPSVIDSFPTFAYSEVKRFKIGKGALECAVCISEFEDDEVLRLLPKCDHVFHPDCVDAWLESHVTCPVCRSDLVPVPGESNHFHLPDLPQTPEDNPTPNPERNDDVSIPVPEETQVNVSHNQSPLPVRPQTVNRNFSFDRNRPPGSRFVRPKLFPFGKFRSNSTGHSLVQAGANLERFTLRLPDDVRKEMMSRAMLNRTGSSVRRYRTGEGSTRGRSYRRLESLGRIEVRSDRWFFSITPPFFSRGPSLKMPKMAVDDGESSRSAKTPRGLTSAVKMPFQYLDHKSSPEPGPVPTDPDRPPV